MLGISCYANAECPSSIQEHHPSPLSQASLADLLRSGHGVDERHRVNIVAIVHQGQVQQLVHIVLRQGPNDVLGQPLHEDDNVEAGLGEAAEDGSAGSLSNVAQNREVRLG